MEPNQTFDLQQNTMGVCNCSNPQPGGCHACNQVAPLEVNPDYEDESNYYVDVDDLSWPQDVKIWTTDSKITEVARKLLNEAEKSEDGSWRVPKGLFRDLEDAIDAS